MVLGGQHPGTSAGPRIDLSIAEGGRLSVAPGVVAGPLFRRGRPELCRWSKTVHRPTGDGDPSFCLTTKADGFLLPVGRRPSSNCTLADHCRRIEAAGLKHQTSWHALQKTLQSGG